MIPDATLSARFSNAASIARAAVSSLQPVETSQTMPCPSRNFASHFGDSVTIRSEPSCPVVTFAVRVLPFFGFHRAYRWPLLVKSSAPTGSGRVVCFLKTVPIVQPSESLDPSNSLVAHSCATKFVVAHFSRFVSHNARCGSPVSHNGSITLR